VINNLVSKKANIPLVFLHIPKTAGTTLWLILRRQYSPEHVLRMDNTAEISMLPAEHLAQVQVLLGHFPYGTGALLPLGPDRITLMRDPVERILSSYSHRLRAELTDRSSPQTSPLLTLDEYIASPLGEMDNRMTRTMAGPEAMVLPHGALTQDHFEQAKQNLANGVSVFGLTEQFDETLVILQRRYGWNIPLYVRANVGTGRLQRQDVPPEIMAHIQETTHWDKLLYEFASERFQEQVATEGAEFAEAVVKFQRANAWYGRTRALIAASPLPLLKRKLTMSRQMKIESAVRTMLKYVMRFPGRPRNP
jgi:hypothetical protein